jgi:hypothetical protein
MSNGTPPPAPHVIAVDDNARWLFPLERAPPPPRNEGCILHGLSNPTPLQSNGSSPPIPLIMLPLPSSHKSSTRAATSLTQTVFDEIRDTMKCVWEEMEEIRVSSRRFAEDMKELRLRQASYQFKETLRHDINIFRPERLIKDETTPEAFLRIKEVNDACAASLDTILRSRTTRRSMKRPASQRSRPIRRHRLQTRRRRRPHHSQRRRHLILPPPRPTYSSMGKYTPLTGWDPSMSTPALHASSSTRTSTAITPSPMARRRNRPRRRPGRRHRPRAPEAIPSQPVPVPTTEGTPVPTATHLSLAQATAICHSTSPHMVTVPPPHQPFIIRHTGAGDVVSTGGRNDSFRDCGERLRKRPRRRPLARHVCRRHGPRAPSSLVSLCGRRHWPRAPSFPEAF